MAQVRSQEEKLEWYRRQLTACCGPTPTKPRPLSGIEKRELDPDAHLDDIDDEYRRAMTKWFES